MSSSPPVAESPPIDRDHLDRATLGDGKLEREVLVLFRDQSERLLQELKCESGDHARLVHTLKGSARAIGAFQVARAAEILETAAGKRSDALENLEVAIADARRAAGDILDCG